MVAVIFKITEHTAGVAAMIRLRKAKTTQPLAAGQLRQVFAALFFAAIFIDGEHHQRTLNRSRTTDAAVPPLQLLHHQAITDIIQPPAAILLRDGSPKTTQVPQLLDYLPGKLRPLRIILDYGGVFLFYVMPDGIPDQLMLICQ